MRILPWPVGREVGMMCWNNMQQRSKRRKTYCTRKKNIFRNDEK
jgi:hypothetical protein